MSRRVFVAVGLAVGLGVILIGTWGCAARQPVTGQDASDLDRKLSTYAWIEEGDLVTFIVGTRATRYREDSAYIPLEICISNNGLKRLILTRESFVLVDEQGNRYPAASPRELMEGYDFLDLDRERLAELSAIIYNKFAAYTQYGSKFSPTHSTAPFRENLVRDMVSLPRFGYILDFLYFPHPAGQLKGQRLELFLESPDLPDPVFLKFVVL